MLGRMLDHEIRVYVLNGHVAHFTLRELRGLYATPQFWVMISFGFVIMSTGHSLTLPQFDHFGVRLAFWIVALAIYLLASETYAYLTWSLWDRLFKGPIPLILMSIPLLVAATVIAAGVLSALFEPDRNPLTVMSWQMHVRNIIVCHVFETASLLWLMPAMRAAKAEQVPTRKVTLAGRSFALSDIQRVKAAEHYLELYGTDGIEVIRERMSTFLEQVSDEDGIQTHRSHWIARPRAAEMKGDSLRLTCGGKVPVARGRIAAVKSWLSAQGCSETSSDR